MSDGYSSRLWECPFFMRDDRARIKCELADLRFTSQAEASGFATKYCANCSGWKVCTIAKHLNERYEMEDK